MTGLTLLEAAGAGTLVAGTAFLVGEVLTWVRERTRWW